MNLGPRVRRSATLRSFGLLCCSTLIGVASAGVARAEPPAEPQAPQVLTVERIYSAPSLSGRPMRDTSWSPDGKWLSFLDETDGAGPEIAAVDAATGQRKVLVDPARLQSVWLPPASRGQQTGLGRYAPSRYLWSPDGKSLLFISAQELFWYDLGGGKSKTLLAAKKGSSDDANIDDAKISPDGRWVSFVRNHDIWLVPVGGGAPRQLTRGGSEDLHHGDLDWVYPEELNLLEAYWWSPDSSHIAYLELNEQAVSRYPLVDYLAQPPAATEERFPLAGTSNPAARVGVADVTGGETRWMDTGSDQTALLARTVWLPDSSRVAIERLNRVQNRLDLLFADASSGKSQVVFTEQDKYWIEVADDFRFVGKDRFLWSSERSGFRHLYLYDLAGKQLAQLTSGNWEVTGVEGVDEKDGQVYFTSTQKSPVERQFYRVSFSGGAPVPLTHDHGTHSANLAPDCGHFLDSYSTAMMPPRQDLYRNDGTRVAVLDDNRVPELEGYQLPPVQFLTIPGADGTPLDAELIRPPDFAPAKRYPVILYVYGGPQAQVAVDEWQGSTFLWNEMMAQKGFLVLVVDTRGTAGRGHGFDTPVFHHFGDAELADLSASVSWLKKQPDVDAARIRIWGWSFGGYMTCLAMLRSGDLFKAGVAVAPVTDWKLYDTIYTERYMGTPQENASGYHDSSPVNYAQGLQGKLLIVHATGDDNVHFANFVEMSEQFVLAQKNPEYDVYAGRGHGITDAPARVHLFNRLTDFFVDNLMK